jgi:hypothetical protein
MNRKPRQDSVCGHCKHKKVIETAEYTETDSFCAYSAYSAVTIAWLSTAFTTHAAGGKICAKQGLQSNRTDNRLPAHFSWYPFRVRGAHCVRGKQLTLYGS